MSIHQTTFLNTHYTPTFSDEWSSSMNPLSTPVLQPTAQSELNTLNVWEHFHSMPTQGNQRTWNQFFDWQDALVNRSPVAISAYSAHELRLPLATGETTVKKAESLFKAKPGIPDKPEIKVVPEHLQEKIRIQCPIEVCEKDFKERYELKRHLLVVHPEQKELFDSLFKQTAKNEKKFPCPISVCKSGFSHRKDLLKHLYKKHKKQRPIILLERPYLCTSPGCPSRYSSRKSLLAHVRKKHRESLNAETVSKTIQEG